MTKEQIIAILENARSWPVQDQEELAELAREIEARRSGVYVLSADERAAIDKALASPLVNYDGASVFKSIPVEDRLRLVGDLWDSIAHESDALPPLTDEQKQELDRRLAEHDADPSSALEWSQVREELWARVKAK